MGTGVTHWPFWHSLPPGATAPCQTRARGRGRAREQRRVGVLVELPVCDRPGLIYGLLWKQSSLSPPHYEFTFTYITPRECHTHTHTHMLKNSGVDPRERERERITKINYFADKEKDRFLPFRQPAQVSGTSNDESAED